MKRALVTGGSSPIGAAIARRLARAGDQVWVHGFANRSAVDSTVEDIRSAGGRAEPLILDLTDIERSDATLTALSEEAPFQILVHNAGIHRDAPFAGLDFADWKAVIDVNLHGFFAALRPLILPMMRSRWGRIVAISSLTAIAGNRGQTNYAAAKGAYLPLFKSLTKEYAARGITANVVAPGLIETPETEALPNLADLIELCPMRRAGTPGDVADLVGFLTSDQARYISGQMIALDGGTT